MITVVSGMARSGTSLTMQMLNAAGVPLYWNMEPNFGPGNPRGYFEVEGRDWREHTDIEAVLSKMEGKVTKVFPRNWDYSTDLHKYQIIYLDRDPVNIRDSQIRMLDVEGRRNRKGKPEEHLRAVVAYRRRALKLIKEYKHVIVQYEELFTGKAQTQISSFLKLKATQRCAMLQCVDPNLHHFKPEGQ